MSSIQQRPLNRILEDLSTNKGKKTRVPDNIRRLKEFIMKSHFFKINQDKQDDVLGLNDVLKVITFLIVFSNAKLPTKVEMFIKTIEKEADPTPISFKDTSDYDISASDNAVEIQYHKKHPKMLEVLSVQLSSAILPFVYYFEGRIDDEKFIRFRGIS